MIEGEREGGRERGRERERERQTIQEGGERLKRGGSAHGRLCKGMTGASNVWPSSSSEHAG